MIEKYIRRAKGDRGSIGGVASSWFLPGKFFWEDASRDDAEISGRTTSFTGWGNHHPHARKIVWAHVSLHIPSWPRVESDLWRSVRIEVAQVVGSELELDRSRASSAVILAHRDFDGTLSSLDFPLALVQCDNARITKTAQTIKAY